MSGPPVGARTAALTDRATALESALQQAAGVVDAELVGQLQQDVARVRDRLALGVDRTVVALVGGTGSGKSSLFNAITRLQFADVGDIRPTTSRPAACVWGPAAAPLLDWLGVDRDRRIQRESELDADEERELAGLVLVDLPDHDSVRAEHRAVVDRVLPHADLVVWVVDPQKYADEALHEGYLGALVGRDESTLVVLNQVDTVPDGHRAALLADLHRLLVEDGLTGVDALAVSARTGAGIAQLRERLVAVVARQSSAATHAGAELDAAAAALAQAVGPAGRAVQDDDVTLVADTLAAAAGLDAVGAAVGASLRAGRDLPDGVATVHEDGAALARAQWLTRTTAGLPGVWAKEVAERVATPAELRLAVSEALAETTADVRRSRSAARLLPVGLTLVAIGALVAVGVAVGLPGWALPVGAAVAVAGLVVAVVATWLRRRHAGRQADRVLRRGRASIEATVRARLADPTRDVLARRERLRALVATASS